MDRDSASPDRGHALAAGLPVWLEGAIGLPLVRGEAGLIAVYAILHLVVAGSYARLRVSAHDASTPRVKGAELSPLVNPLRSPSRRIILTLNGLFSVDQLASSLTTASLMAYWFHTRFGLEHDQLALLNAAAQLLSAASMWLSTLLSRRIGYIRTMVFTHIPASLLLLAVALAASPGVAVGLWLARSLLSQMDVPARDALTVSIVRPEERVAMVSLHLVGRNGAGAIGPTLSAWLWQQLSVAAPLLGCGLLKLIYDLSLFALFRDVERETSQLSRPPDRP